MLQRSVSQRFLFQVVASEVLVEVSFSEFIADVNPTDSCLSFLQSSCLQGNFLKRHSLPLPHGVDLGPYSNPSAVRCVRVWVMKPKSMSLKVSLKTPVQSLAVLCHTQDCASDLESLKSYVEDEVNVLEIKVEFSSSLSALRLQPSLNFKLLGKRLGKDMKSVQEAVQALGQEELQRFQKEGMLRIAGHDISSEEMAVSYGVADVGDPNKHTACNGEVVVIVDFTPSVSLTNMAVTRNIVRFVQKLRKEMQVDAASPVLMWVDSHPDLQSILQGQAGQALSEFD